ncbi:hypothetical protein KSF_110740 [Reticulibacter mediterranei]|uniref:Uncharacterized protein n=1 Tax=Reticulibacter mediterranei TaxID=2778369 RepID=A0A8J3J3S2_9CHLR|nr:hypothetical protein [Reticulibacter mediterranei]GHP01027.1 hypothetical protein KSF_110740 [Reticulibacter mediterranei]
MSGWSFWQAAHYFMQEESENGSMRGENWEGVRFRVQKFASEEIDVHTELERIKAADVAISRDGQGHYYVSFVAEREEETCDNNSVVAFDQCVEYS